MCPTNEKTTKSEEEVKINQHQQQQQEYELQQQDDALVEVDSGDEYGEENDDADLSGAEEDYDSNDETDLSDTESVDEADDRQTDSDEEYNEINDATFEENYIQEVVEISQLRQWVLECNIPHSHVDKLISILRPRLLTCLPKTCKTLMFTSLAKYNIEPMSDSDGSIGEFVYFGIEEGLKQCIDPKVHTAEEIQLFINIDGVRLFKSSAKEFWPILGQVHFKPMIYEPFAIAVYSGNSKPKELSEYLVKFVTEVNLLQSEGFRLEDTRYKIKIKCFSCDTPARSFIKATQGHTGKNCCERCCVIGEKVNGVTVFLSTTCAKRTDKSFRNFTKPEHHVNVSPLLLIHPSIDMTTCFVLDFMHLVCLGVMKRLLEFWIYNKGTKISPRSKAELSRRLLAIRKCVPAEFQRKPRELKYLPKWKATEFMFFVLYAGPIILKGILKDLQYDNFLLLHTACRLLCSTNNSNAYTNYAQEYLTKFVSTASDIYGECFTVINVHNLIHLTDDVINMGWG